MSPHHTLSRALSRALCALGLGASLALIATPAHAVGGATRTWVSGVGDDANPCSRTAPCKTFVAAQAQTAPGGVINVLDPGGYGAVTITQPLTIDGGGMLASVITAGTNAIVINTTGNVVLRNLDLEYVGTTPAGCALSGVNIVSAASVELDHLTINAYDNGVSVPATGSSPSVTADDVRVTNSVCTGINASPSAGHTAKVTLSNSQLSGDNTGFQAGTGSVNWISGTQVAFNTKGLSGAGTIHDLCGNTFSGNASDGTFTDHPATCQSPTTGTPAAAPTVTYCVVPNLKGKTKAAAAAALTSAHCAPGALHKKHAPRSKRGKVLSQTVPAGISAKEGTAVGMTVGK